MAELTGNTTRSKVPTMSRQPTIPEPSINTDELSQLFHGERARAKAELKEEAKVLGKSGALVGATGLFGFLALSLVAFGAAWGLSDVIPAGMAFLLVAAVVAAAAVFTFVMGRREIDPSPAIPSLAMDNHIPWNFGGSHGRSRPTHR